VLEVLGHPAARSVVPLRFSGAFSEALLTRPLQLKAVGHLAAGNLPRSTPLQAVLRRLVEIKFNQQAGGLRRPSSKVQHQSRYPSANDVLRLIRSVWPECLSRESIYQVLGSFLRCRHFPLYHPAWCIILRWCLSQRQVLTV